MKLIFILILAFSWQVNAQVEARLDSVCADSGMTTLVSFTTKDFINIATFEGTIRWDPTKLRYDGILNYNTTLGFSAGNVNPSSASSGYLNFSWFDNNVAGITLSNNAIVFQLHFTPLVSSEVIPINFSNNPTAMEFATTSGTVSHVTISGAAVVTDVETSVDGALVTALNDSATYVWLDCDNNNSPIAGANNQSYTALTDGNYAVQLTANGCVDTSACVSVMAVGIIKTSFPSEITVYPNPTQGAFSVDLGRSYESLTTTIMDIKGNVISSQKHNQSDLLNLQIDEAVGAYILVVESEDKKAVIRMVKK